MLSFNSAPVADMCIFWATTCLLIMPFYYLEYVRADQLTKQYIMQLHQKLWCNPHLLNKDNLCMQSRRCCTSRWACGTINRIFRNATVQASDCPNASLPGPVHYQPNRHVSLYLHSFTVSQNKKRWQHSQLARPSRRSLPLGRCSPSPAATTSASSVPGPSLAYAMPGCAAGVGPTAFPCPRHRS
jgi:hypothetical protein